MNFNIITIISCLIYVTFGHMSMQFPLPRDKKGGSNYAVWQQNEPMVSVHPTICHGLTPDSVVRDGNVCKIYMHSYLYTLYIIHSLCVDYTNVYKNNKLIWIINQLY